MGRNFYAPAINLSDCTVRPGSSLHADCLSQAQVLYENGTGIVASFADNGEQLIEPAVRFQPCGQDAVLMHLGLKSETLAALLVKDKGESRLTYRYADYPTPC